MSSEDRMQYVTPGKDGVTYHIEKGVSPGMRVPGLCILNERLAKPLLKEFCQNRDVRGNFTVSLKQVANVACLPGIIKHSIGLPDMHTGYGFSIGNVAAMDLDDPKAVISPGGIGFDINCGVRVVRTNLTLDDVKDRREELAQTVFNHIPVGVGSLGILPRTPTMLFEALSYGMNWSVTNGYAWAEDLEHCEECGFMAEADPAMVSSRAFKRGLPQLGTLGAGNHFVEIQAVDTIYDKMAASRMGIDQKGQIVAMVHSGSRGFGHQVATDALVAMESAMKVDAPDVTDKQLACARFNSPVGQAYYKSMCAAANFAFVNRSAMTFLLRQAFAKTFQQSPDDLDMQVIYDVSHNVGKVEEHLVDGKRKRLLLHRKGATRAFAPFHPQIPVDYQCIGQPVMLGGSMGTYSYILTGTEKAMDLTFGSTAHGAGRASARNALRRHVDYTDVLDELQSQGISARVASPQLLMEEAPEAYHDVNEVVDVCQQAGISKRAVRMKPIAIIKG